MVKKSDLYKVDGDKIERKNPQYAHGKTGYEQYYIDLEGFWRQLYYPPSVRENELMDKELKLRTEYFEKFEKANKKLLLPENKFKKISELIERYNSIAKAFDIAKKNYESTKEIIKSDYTERIDALKQQKEKQKDVAKVTKETGLQKKGSDKKKLEEIYQNTLTDITKQYNYSVQLAKTNKELQLTNAKNEYNSIKSSIYINPQYFSGEGKDAKKNKKAYEAVGEVINEYNKALAKYQTEAKKSRENGEDYKANGWHKTIYENPAVLNFWFDFLDTKGEISEYSVKNIGMRDKVTNDNSCKSIYFKETPKIIYFKDIADRNKKSGYKYFHVTDNVFNLFSCLINSNRFSLSGRSPSGIYK